MTTGKGKRCGDYIGFAKKIMITHFWHKYTFLWTFCFTYKLKDAYVLIQYKSANCLWLVLRSFFYFLRLLVGWFSTSMLLESLSMYWLYFLWFQFDPKKQYKMKNFGGFTLVVHPGKHDNTQKSVNIYCRTLTGPTFNTHLWNTCGVFLHYE